MHVQSYSVAGGQRPCSGAACRPTQARGRGRCVVVHANIFAPLTSLFQRPEQGGLVEKPAYKANEMVQLAPGVQISPMGLGTWAWGNQFLWGYEESQDPQLEEVFNLMVSKGINFFDTADSYGIGKLNGKSEKLLGRFCEEYPGSPRVRSNLHVATKFAAYPWRVLPSQVVAACKGSMQRLNVEQISVGQLHWSAANYAPLQELALQAGIADCYDQGLIKAVGISNYGPKQLLKIHRYLEKRGVPLASMQIQYSLLSSGGMQQEAKAVCDDLGITLIAYSPLALGLLSGRYSLEELPQGPRGALFKGLLPEAQPLLEVMQAVAKGRGKTMSQVAINWCICKGTVPIPGARTMEQARGALGALGWRLNSGEVAELDSAASRIKRGMVQNIFQTA